jgi:archaellum component FlaC
VKNPDTGRIRTLGIPKPNPDREPEYYQTLNELARDITTTLNKLKSETDNKPEIGGLAGMKKKRLENEKQRIEGELKLKNKEYESVLTSMSNPRIPQTTKTNLNNKLDQLETEIGALEPELEQINSQLNKFS